MPKLLELLQGLPPEFVVMALAATPVSELRGALPLAIHTFHMPLWKAYSLAVLGNMLPVPFILLLLKPLSRLCARTRWGLKLLLGLERLARRRGATVERYETLGIALFVAIPLPVTGAWTGALIASVFGLRPGLSFLAILTGVCCAGVIVSLLALMGWWGAGIAGAIILGYFGWQLAKKG